MLFESQEWRNKKVMRSRLANTGLVAVFFTAAILLTAGCGDQSGSTATTSTVKQRLATDPATGKVGQIYFNTTANREYIYDGTEWVPHDKTIDTYVPKNSAQPSSTSSNPVDYCLDSNGYDICPDTMHRKHGAVMNDCQGCHSMSGMQLVWFADPSKPAFISPATPPVFVWGSILTPAVPSTCSNIACHGIASGTFQYYFPGGDGEPQLITVNYGGVSSATASWVNGSPSGGISPTDCSSCHGNPPAGTVYHSGQHATMIPGANGCQFCHPDAETRGSANQLIGGTNPLHMNGTIDIKARYDSRCFGCH